MKRICSMIMVVMLMLTALPVHFKVEATGNLTTHYFSDNDELIHDNPYMGIRFDINPTVNFADPGIDDLINGREIPKEVDLICINLCWADLEPSEGNWQWDRLDRAIAAVKEQGKKVDLSLDMSEGSAFGNYYLPNWIFTQKRVPYRTVDHWGTPVKQPLYYNATYLNLLENAINTIGNRYNGNETITFVTMRVTGRFGEWGGWSDADNFVWPSEEIRDATLHRMIDMYKNAFTKTMVLFQNPASGVLPGETVEDRKVRWAYDYALDNGTDQSVWGLRSDTNKGNWRWQLYDLNYEYGGFGCYINRSYSRDYIMYAEGGDIYNGPAATKDTHLYIDNALYDLRCNVLGFNNAGYDQWEDMLRIWGDELPRATKGLGYRFLLNKATYNSTVSSNGTFTLAQTWTNNGYGHCPKQYPLKVYLADKLTGEVVWTGTDGRFDQRKWFKGEFCEVQSSFTLNGVPAGVYDMRIAMVDEKGKPSIALPMEGGKNKVYSIGQITVGSTTSQFKPGSPRCSVRIECANATKQSNFIATYSVDDSDPVHKDGVNWKEPGHFAEYNNIDLPYDGDYVFELRGASVGVGAVLKIEIDGHEVIGALEMTDTESLSNFTTYRRKLNHLKAGRHIVKISMPGTGNVMLRYFKLIKEDMYNIHLEAEDYTAEYGTWTEKGLFDAGDTTSIACLETGDYLEYENVDIPVNGTYDLQFRVATNHVSTQKFKVFMDGTDITGEIVIPDTGGLNTYRTVTKKVTLPAGVHRFKVSVVYGDTNIFLNWMKFNLKSAQRIETEAFDTAEGISVFSSGDIDGTDAIRSTQTSSRAKYNNIYVPKTGVFTARFRISASSPNQTIQLLTDGLNVTGEMAVPNAGKFIMLERNVYLTEGIHTFEILTAGQSVECNYIEINFDETVIDDTKDTIEAENYSAVDGISLTAIENSLSGIAATSIDTGDYLQYDSLRFDHTGVYQVCLRISTLSENQSICLYIDEVAACAPIVLPSTGGLDNFQTVEQFIYVTAGVHSIKLVVINGNSQTYLDNIRFNLNTSHEIQCRKLSLFSLGDLTEEGGILYNIQPQTTITQLIQRMTILFGVKLSFLRNLDSLKPDDYAGTGLRIQVDEPNNRQRVYSVSIRGEVTGDGLINNDDIVESKKIIAGIKEPESMFFKSIDVNKDEILSSDDVIAIKKQFVGLGNICQE